MFADFWEVNDNTVIAIPFCVFKICNYRSIADRNFLRKTKNLVTSHRFYKGNLDWTLWLVFEVCDAFLAGFIRSSLMAFEEKVRIGTYLLVCSTNLVKYPQNFDKIITYFLQIF